MTIPLNILLNVDTKFLVRNNMLKIIGKHETTISNVILVKKPKKYNGR